MSEKPQTAEGLTNYVAGFVAAARPSDIPAGVVELGKKSILDGLGLALSGAVAASGKLVARHLDELNLGAGASTAIGMGRKVAPRFAAFANGVAWNAVNFAIVLFILTRARPRRALQTA